MINVAGDELECLLLSEKSESGGTGRRARLRGVWIHRTGSSPVSRTKDCFERNSPFFFLKCSPVKFDRLNKNFDKTCDVFEILSLRYDREIFA